MRNLIWTNLSRNRSSYSSKSFFFYHLNNFFSQQIRTIFETKYHNDFSCKVMYQFKNQGKDIIKSPSVQLDWVLHISKKKEWDQISAPEKKIASSTCFKVRYECAYYMSARRTYVRLASRWFYYGVLRYTNFSWSASKVSYYQLYSYISHRLSLPHISSPFVSFLGKKK